MLMMFVAAGALVVAVALVAGTTPGFILAISWWESVCSSPPGG